MIVCLLYLKNYKEVCDALGQIKRPKEEQEGPLLWRSLFSILPFVFFPSHC